MGIIPAYAGSTAVHAGERLGEGDHPRIRGEHLGGGGGSCRLSGSSPHTRGAPFRGARVKSSTRDHPRIRGEHLAWSGVKSSSSGSSPHTRGARRLRHGDRAGTRIIPAYAGSTRSRRSPTTSSWDHPRIRGEHVDYEYLTTYYDGSSPHTRGALWGAVAEAVADTDHPRIRGEHARDPLPREGGRGSSPHTRGAPAQLAAALPPSGIIPAYAGSTRSCRALSARCRDHPRIRGEHRLSGLYTGDGQGSSPHTRGARKSPRKAREWPRIIPAYAGSTHR